MKIGFYVLGKKGYFSLEQFRKSFGVDSIAFVMGASDGGVANDWSSEIATFCSLNSVPFHVRGEASEDLLPFTDFEFAIGWRWMIKGAANLVVFHDSLLPKYRGFAPLVNMLVDGASEIGVTALLASDEYDKGALVYQVRKSVSYPLKISDAIDEIIPLYAEVVIKAASDILMAGRVNSFPQNEELASYSLWRDESDYFIDWGSDAERVRRFIDAVGPPYQGAAACLNGEVVRIYDAQLVDDVIVENRQSCIGKIIFFYKGIPVVVCGRGLLKITDIRSNEGSSLVGKIQFRSRFESKN